MPDAAPKESLFEKQLVETWARRPVNPDRLAALRRYAAPRMLDVGCGNGQYVFELQDRCEVHGVDIEPYESWQQLPARFQVGDISRLHYDDQAFGTVSAFEVLEHLEAPGVAIRELARVASQFVIVTVPNCEITDGMRRSLLIPHHWQDRTHVQSFTLESLETLFTQAGLRIVESIHINRIRPERLLTEYARLSDPIGWFLLRWLRWRKRRDYYLTCLVVGEKAGK
jgi:SAM-dependent methyltransferase